MELIVEWILPIRTWSELNKHEHWRAGHLRHQAQKYKINMHYRHQGIRIDPPAHIVLSRMSPRLLDDDNLPGALKYCRDALADCIVPGLKPGRSDDEKYGLSFEVKQEKAKEYALKIQIYKESNVS